ncbi:hypothetical protein B296_00001553 [Ensete ventricosum]|uniref:Uncharacterized protein n=1 Tax=Ensete ventricosum TaxID=4639 RepID=A0A427AZ68_ENSVE|nr:hypothetical protein B296_00001553 [Ensete ventricosum]
MCSAFPTAATLSEISRKVATFEGRTHHSNPYGIPPRTGEGGEETEGRGLKGKLSSFWYLEREWFRQEKRSQERSHSTGLGTTDSGSSEQQQKQHGLVLVEASACSV